MHIVPTKGKLMSSLSAGIVGGIAGGVPSALLTKLTGSPFIGQLVGSTIGSAFVKDEMVRKAIVVNGWMDAINSLLILGV